jgi:hypothetical protein
MLRPLALAPIDCGPLRINDLGMRDKGLHRLARELSSAAFLTGGNKVVAYPSSYIERDLLKPKVWTPLLHERVRTETQNELDKLARGESSADDRGDILFNIEQKFGRGPSTIEALISVTGRSSAVK